MNQYDTVVVAGLGRCGLSLMMQMLDAGGFPVLGTFPSYEDFPIGEVQEKSGCAVKVVDPQHWTMPVGPWRCILMSRDEKQQAKSIVKFSKALNPLLRKVRQNNGQMRDLEKSLRVDYDAFVDYLLREKIHTIPIRFERLIEEPLHTISRVSDFIADIAPLDVIAAVKQVRHRGTFCLPRLLEADLIKEGKLL